MVQRAKKYMTLARRKQDKVSRRIKVGDLLQDDDWAVVAYPDMFDNVNDVVEQATAAPGEKRSVKKPKAKDE